MTAPIPIPANERHTLRVFTLETTAAEVDRLRDGRGNPIAALLGVSSLDPDYAEVFDVKDLGDLGLAAYLIDGNGVAEAQIAADRARLDAIRGFVLIVHTAAFGGQAATLHPDARLTLIGTYAEDIPPVRFEPLPDAAAKGVLEPGMGKKPMSEARISGMVATVVLVFLFVLVAFFVWSAG